MMGYSLGAIAVWFLLANVVAMFPSKDHHWRFAYGMIAVGVPILVWVTYENGVLIGMIALVAAASVLRWPLIYLGRWLRSVSGR